MFEYGFERFLSVIDSDSPPWSCCSGPTPTYFLLVRNGVEKGKPRCGWTFAPRLPETNRRKPAPVILSEKELHYVQMAPTEADALIAYRCLTAVVARARHRGLRI